MLAFSLLLLNTNNWNSFRYTHIQYLQQYYGAKLLVYRNKQLTLTPEGELLRRATLTIGEYLLPERVAFYSQAGEGRLAKG